MFGYRPRIPYGFLRFMVLSCILLLIFDGVCGKGGGRGGGGGRGSYGGSSRSGSSRTSYGGSSRSSAPARSSYQAPTATRTNYGSSAASGRASVPVRYNNPSGGGGATRYGSSAPTGGSSVSNTMRNRYTGGGGTSFAGGGSRSYGGGATYRAPSPTMSRFSPGTARAARPQANVPRSSVSQPTKVVYSTTYTTNYGSMGRSGYSGSSMLMAGVGGYALGSMMSRSHYGYGGYGYGYGGCYGCYGYGYYPYYSTYVPYRERYGSSYPATTPSPTINQSPSNGPEVPKRELDICTLARWNRELPFAELPNMALEFLSNDTITNSSMVDKAKFVYDFFKSSVDAYAGYNSSSDVFTIPPAYNLQQCNILPTANFDPTKPAPSGPEEPVLTSARNIIAIYSNISKDGDAMLKDVVEAARACLPPAGGPVPQPQVLPCLDFTLNPDQLVKLDEVVKLNSIFSNGEICRRHLGTDFNKCVSAESTTAKCRGEHIVALNLFARNYYLCTKELEDEQLQRAQRLAQGLAVDDQNSAASSILISCVSLVVGAVLLRM